MINKIFDIHIATFQNYYSIWIYLGFVIATFTILDLEENENILGLEMLDEDDEGENEVEQ